MRMVCPAGHARECEPITVIAEVPGRDAVEYHPAVLDMYGKVVREEIQAEPAVDAEPEQRLPAVCHFRIIDLDPATGITHRYICGGLLNPE